MTAMFPDSGVPSTDAKNSIIDPNTVNCNELWYSTSRCQPRFDPAAANAMLSEQINLINKAEVAYDCNSLAQLQLATRYLIQRGLTNGTILSGGPINYTCAMDPTLTRYNDYLTLVVIPVQNNAGSVQINVDGLGWHTLFRNDAQPLQANDLIGGVPALITYYGNFWFYVGLCASQVPKITLSGSFDLWVRTDGNDTTGDGSANTPDKAFRTLDGAWKYAGDHFMSTPQLSLNFRLGIPGTYVGTVMGPFGGNIQVSGDPVGRAGYLISNAPNGNNNYAAFTGISINRLYLYGLTLLRDTSSGPSFGLWNNACNCWLDNVDFDVTVPNAVGGFINYGNAATNGTYSDVTFNGRGTSMNMAIAGGGGFFGGGRSDNLLPKFVYNFNDCHFSSAAWLLRAAAIMYWDDVGAIVNDNGCTGAKYLVTENSVMNLSGIVPPGDTPGSVGSGGQFIP
jgi:hypothetical protein